MTGKDFHSGRSLIQKQERWLGAGLHSVTLAIFSALAFILTETEGLSRGMTICIIFKIVLAPSKE